MRPTEYAPNLSHDADPFNQARRLQPGIVGKVTTEDRFVAVEHPDAALAVGPQAEALTARQRHPAPARFDATRLRYDMEVA